MQVKAILQELDSGILEDIACFINTASPETYSGRIPTALVTIGSNVTALTRLLGRLHLRLVEEKKGEVVLLESGDAPNLKTVLKNIIRTAVTNTEGNEGYQKLFTDSTVKGPRLLPYDLNLLQEYVKHRGVKKLVLAFRDSEAFDQGVLNDLLSLISSWLDRIPFTLLFGISTSIELFEGRLPRSIVALLEGRCFEIHDAGDSVDRIYNSVQTSQNVKLWIGPHLSSFFFERARDYFQSPEGFIREVKYAYMSHFFANPLSVFLSDDISATLQQTELCEAIRNLPSFRRFCESLLDAGNSEYVRNLLSDDKFLFDEVMKNLETCLYKMGSLFRTVKTILTIQRVLKLPRVSSATELTLQAVAGELRNSSMVQDVLVAMKKLDSEGLSTFLTALQSCEGNVPDFQGYQEELAVLVKSQGSAGPLRSKYDDQNATVKTTIFEQRVNLSRTQTQLSEQDTQYTKLVERCYEALDEYLAQNLINPQELFLNEIFVFDLKKPLKDTFVPRARFAIERALSSPFDYLISASDKVEGHLSARQPETAILYQLYLESGSLVNIYDLWRAFYTITGGEEGESCDERSALMLFYRALSELKALGMVKGSRKKIDHVSKSAWRGL
ncbi:Uncharacterized protein T310_5211 [Rasamsonia emersonii CBS 393.64]|uniref:Uncharacterized protein n=1 Tax=Rasamsonia emersonii (strain ATCC 16479 / CBS 393.64 / IMI 116815) TaxID=1408163 RepID=A0A0F4YSE3_RASE3|nr:Uncharacterized protein T310_5211 [Rasamsonia emersonii CBS 393.64]KKA20761.1 Uncharacterized protein T310_5211 [Rasamsonia emersonii CBS 393.64]